MNLATILLILFVFFANLFWTYSLVSRIYYYDGYTDVQKRIQIILCILFPFIWPIVVTYVTRSNSISELREEREKAQNEWGNSPSWPKGNM
jgi:hypothetical protein